MGLLTGGARLEWGLACEGVGGKGEGLMHQSTDGRPHSPVGEGFEGENQEERNETTI